MKYTRILLILGLLGFAVPSKAYIFDFSNHTNYPLRVKLQLNGINEPWEEGDLPAKQQYYFNWTALGHSTPSLNIWKAGFCLQWIQVQTPIFVKTTKIDEDGNNIIEYEIDYVKNNVNKPVLDRNGNKIVQWNPWRNVVVTWVKNEAYDRIIDAAKAFSDGFADLAAKTASVALGGVPMPEFKLGDIADAIGTWVKYSFCRDRHFDVIEDAELSSPTTKSFKFLVEGRG